MITIYKLSILSKGVTLILISIYLFPEPTLHQCHIHLFYSSPCPSSLPPFPFPSSSFLSAFNLPLSFFPLSLPLPHYLPFLPSPYSLPPSFPHSLSSFHLINIPSHDMHLLFSESNRKHWWKILSGAKDNQPRQELLCIQRLPENLEVSHKSNTHNWGHLSPPVKSKTWIQLTPSPLYSSYPLLTLLSSPC